LQEGLGLVYSITNDKVFFENSDLPKINYSDKSIENSLQIKPHTILFDHGIRDYHLEVKNSERFYKVFFKNNLSEIPFDFFGASFWLLTRYEEYLPFKADNYNRFNYRSSLAYQYDFIQVPLVNIWLNEVKNVLLSHFPSLEFNTRSYTYLSTVDIDNAFKYKYKGFVRTLAGIISDRNFKKLVERFSIIMSKKTDPFDCYNFLI